MAWWRSGKKRDSENEPVAEADSELGGSIERAHARGSQPNAVPSPRQEAPEPAVPDLEVEYARGGHEPLAYGPAEERISDTERWHLIKRDLEEIDPEFLTDLEQIAKDAEDAPEPLETNRIIAALKNLDIRYLIDEHGGVVALWERHIVQIRPEGPDADILVLRARAYQTVPRDWAERGYAAMNEWNRSRRFLKAYLGEPTESGSLPVFGEIQVPVRPGITAALLEELIDCGTAISGTFVEWLEGELL